MHSLQSPHLLTEPRSCLRQRDLAQRLLQVTVVYKFGGSSVADAARMREVAEIICSFPEHLPCVVMSAMGKTTNLLLEAGHQSIEKGTESIPSLKPLRQIKELHRDTCGSLDLHQDDVSAMERLLTELQQLLTGLSIMQVRATMRRPDWPICACCCCCCCKRSDWNIRHCTAHGTT